MGDGPGRRRWSSIFRRSPALEVEEELAFHLEERVSEFVPAGMSPEEARTAALERLGNLEGVRRECAGLLAAERRADERSRRVYLSWLDVKLGIRMLVKYPGLTLVGGIAIAFAIWVGASGYEIMSQAARPTLPLEEGDRVMGIRLMRGASGSDEERAFHEFLLQSEGVRTVEDIGAFRTVERNLVVDGDRAEPVAVAEITASGFRLARIAPLLGRVLDRSDEAAGAPPVLVIGYDEWQDRFGGCHDVVGKIVRLGREQATIIRVPAEADPCSPDRTWSSTRVAFTVLPQSKPRRCAIAEAVRFLSFNEDFTKALPAPQTTTHIRGYKRSISRRPQSPADREYLHGTPAGAARSPRKKQDNGEKNGVCHPHCDERRDQLLVGQRLACHERDIVPGEHDAAGPDHEPYASAREAKGDRRPSQRQN
ncbi:MAG: hypothetical protein GEU90_16845 [Gemmatimonas sp.]|nr:hypothetical protein [Gemmatimonas sp.]